MMLLTRLAKQGMRHCSADMLGLDLRLVMALSYLGDHDGIPQQELVDAFWMDAKNVVLLLNELEDGGYLIRRRDLEDRRRHRVYITDAGRDALERAARAQEQIEERVLGGLSADERAAFRKLLIRALQTAEPAESSARDAVAAAS
jgi:DNA-binding MarR family transcriptional regulator